MLDLPFDRLTAAWTPIAPEDGDDVWLRELTARYLGLELSESLAGSVAQGGAHPRSRPTRPLCAGRHRPDEDLGRCPMA